MSEQLVWKGTPSQASNTLWFLGCLLIIPIPWAIYHFVKTRNTIYEVTTERLRITTGTFSRTSTEIELYRVRDYTIEEPFWLRLVGCANLRIDSFDKTNPVLTLHALKNAAELRDSIRTNVERLRGEKKVREVDLVQ